MSLFNQASLVLEPAVYETSKVYATKPFDGSGDLSFSRSNDTATRVGPDGLIEKVRTNVALYSEDLTNAAWTKGLITITANAATAPDGTTTADQVNHATAFGELVQNNASIGGGLYTYSFYAKYVDEQWIRPLIGSPTNNISVWFDIQNGVKGSQGGSGTSTYLGASITNVGNGWYRCSISANNASTSGNYIQVNSAIADGSNTREVGSFLYWGAMAESGDVMTDYIPTTSAAVSVGPVANVPRLDYLNSSCPRLILEGQRTNLITFSENFENAAWSQTRMTTTANNAISPDGYQNADLIANTTDTGGHNTAFNMGTLTNPSIALSFFVKKKDNDFVQIGMFNNSTNWNAAKFNIETGSVIGSGAAGTNSTPTNAKIEDYGSGWYRISATFAATITGTIQAYIVPTPTSSTPTGNFGYGSWTGATTENVWVYGAQAENGVSYPTSYIPTLGAAVTRGAETAIKTSATALIGQTEGTIFLEFQKNAGVDAANIAFSLSDGTSANLIYYNFEGPVIEFIASSSVQAIKSGGINLVAGTNKIAVYYKANDFGIYLNGTSIFTDTSGSVGAMSKFNLGSFFNDAYPVGTPINQAILFKTRLTNAQLAELTTL